MRKFTIGADYKYNRNYSYKLPENDALDESSSARLPLSQVTNQASIIVIITFLMKHLCDSKFHKYLNSGLHRFARFTNNLKQSITEQK